MATVNRVVGESHDERNARVQEALGFGKNRRSKAPPETATDEGLDAMTTAHPPPDSIFIKPQLLKRPSSRNSNSSTAGAATVSTTSSSPKNVAVSPCDSGVGSVESSPTTDSSEKSSGNSPFAQPSPPTAQEGVAPDPRIIRLNRRKSDRGTPLQDPRLVAREKRGRPRGLVLPASAKSVVQEASPFREPELPPYRSSQFESSPAAAHCSPIHASGNHLFSSSLQPTAMASDVSSSLSSTAYAGGSSCPLLSSQLPSSLLSTSSSHRSSSAHTTSIKANSNVTNNNMISSNSPASSNPSTVQSHKDAPAVAASPPLAIRELFKLPAFASSPQILNRFRRHRQLKSMKRGFATDPMFASEYYDHLSAGVKSKQLKLISDENQKFLEHKLETIQARQEQERLKQRDTTFRVPDTIPAPKWDS